MSFFRQLYLIITGQIEELSVEWEHLENPKKIGIVESCDVLNLKKFATLCNCEDDCSADPSNRFVHVDDKCIHMDVTSHRIMGKKRALHYKQVKKLSVEMTK
ncbi:MAG TPA: hypothetical protein VIH04_03305 [Nitrosarchaeum sp.]